MKADGVSLLDWIERPAADRGVHAFDGTSWTFVSYDELAERVRVASAELLDGGLRAGDLVGLADSGCDDFLVAFFAVLHAGGTALSLPLAGGLGGLSNAHLDAVFASAAPRFLISHRSSEVDAWAAAQRHRKTGFISLGGRGDPANERRDPAEVALLQYTSGSTARPRGVKISWRALEENIAMIRTWQDWNSSDSTASWLPLHHDMGLIGGALSSVCSQTDLWQMSPGHFLRDPVRWLECFGTGRATLTAAPTFAYGYAARRVRGEQLEGLDFSGWRSAVVGAERIVPGPLRAFAALLGERGFRPETLRPAYGLAEATLAVTGHSGSSVARIHEIDWPAARIGARVSTGRSEPLTAFEPDQSGWLVSSGEPLRGLTVTVIDERGSALADGHLGEVVVEGPSIADGYDHPEGPTVTQFRSRRLHTGDAGLLIAGELVVLGRLADGLKVRGRYVYAESVETAIAAALEPSRARCAVCAIDQADAPAIVAVLELEAGPWVGAVARILRAAVGPSIGARIYAAPAGAIPHTSSGKPRRRELARRVVAGELDAELIQD